MNISIHKTNKPKINKTFLDELTQKLKEIEENISKKDFKRWGSEDIDIICN